MLRRLNYLHARWCVIGNRLLLIPYHVRNRYMIQPAPPTADGQPRVQIKLTVVTRVAPLISLYNAYMHKIPYCGQLTNADGQKIKAPPACQRITRVIQCCFPSMICRDMLSSFYDPEPGAICLLYAEGEGNSLSRVSVPRSEMERTSSSAAEGIPVCPFLFFISFELQ